MQHGDWIRLRAPGVPASNPCHGGFLGVLRSGQDGRDGGYIYVGLTKESEEKAGYNADTAPQTHLPSLGRDRHHPQYIPIDIHVYRSQGELSSRQYSRLGVSDTRRTSWGPKADGMQVHRSCHGLLLCTVKGRYHRIGWRSRRTRRGWRVGGRGTWTGRRCSASGVESGSDQAVGVTCAESST